MKQIKVAVLCGGSSAERKISLRSGKAIHGALKKAGLSASLVDPKRRPLSKKNLKVYDVVFIALHGMGGEDGALQAKLDRWQIPYVGSDAEACQQSFDKARAKRILQKNRIPTPHFRVLTKANWKKASGSFPEPFFVKPIGEGSSIGAFSVEDSRKSAEKIKKQVYLYKKLLMEEKLEGREFTVGILGRQALPVIELRPKRLFYDYKAKYTKGMTRYLIPAPISARFEKKLRNLALRVHRILGLRDLSRVDFMTDQAGNPYVLEANTIPGFTELSLLPKAAKFNGISFQDVCLSLVKGAYKRRKV